MSGDPRRLTHLSDLAREPAIPVGSRVLVAEDGHIYISIGNTTPAIAARLGWTQANVWMPEHVLTGINWRHPVIIDPITSASRVLQAPLSVHEDPRGRPDHSYWIIPAQALRNEGLLASRSTRYVDAVVELRYVGESGLLRIFHLSPRSRNQGGLQLWP